MPLLVPSTKVYVSSFHVPRAMVSSPQRMAQKTYLCMFLSEFYGECNIDVFSGLCVCKSGSLFSLCIPTSIIDLIVFLCTTVHVISHMDTYRKKDEPAFYSSCFSTYSNTVITYIHLCCSLSISISIRYYCSPETFC